MAKLSKSKINKIEKHHNRKLTDRHELSRDAQENKQFSASINAEKIRSALGGLSTDRRSSEVTHVIDQMSKDEIVARLYALQKNYPQAFVINEDVEDAESRDESLEYLPTKTEG